MCGGVNAVVEAMCAGVSHRGLICAPLDGAGASRLDELDRCSWGRVHELARNVAGGLARAGVGRGDAVAVLAGAPGEVAALVQGIWLCGASVTMVHHPTHRTDLAVWAADTGGVLAAVGASTLVVGDPFLAAVGQFEPPRV